MYSLIIVSPVLTSAAHGGTDDANGNASPLCPVTYIEVVLYYDGSVTKFRSQPFMASTAACEQPYVSDDDRSIAII